MAKYVALACMDGVIKRNLATLWSIFKFTMVGSYNFETKEHGVTVCVCLCFAYWLGCKKSCVWIISGDFVVISKFVVSDLAGGWYHPHNVYITVNTWGSHVI